MIDSLGLGDRMKLYEMAEAGRKLMPLLPICARMDGKAFRKFTAGLKRPYDERLSRLMIAVTKWLVEETVALMGYTQSDEITLTWYYNNTKSQVMFDGRIQKIISYLSAITSTRFNKLLPEYLPQEYVDKMPTFDARVWNVPNTVEGSNAFLWREWDATKNSISMAARHYYSHNALMNKNGAEMQELLFQKGVNYNDYPSFFKRGTFVQCRTVTRSLTAEEMEELPERHAARINPDLRIERSVIQQLDMPPFSKVVNRPDVIYLGEDPITEDLSSTDPREVEDE